jgi:beta-glucosidase
LVGKPHLAKGPFAGKPSEAIYDEGIYVGYRHYNTFGVKPAYEFGYGLSYTRFSYGEPSVVFTGTAFDVKVTVKNTGRVPGREVVQVYMSAPGRRLKKPASELKSFGKTKLLAPGESETLTLRFRLKDLLSYDASCSCWAAERGTYTAHVAASSLDVRSSVKLKLP